MKLLIKSAWGSDDPTKAAFPFLHPNAFVEAGHEVQVFLPGEAVSLMRTPVANAVVLSRPRPRSCSRPSGPTRS